MEKQNCFEIAFATPQAPEPRKTETNQVSSHAATVDNTLNPIQRSGVGEGHSTYEPRPGGNTLQIGKFYTLILQTAMDELRPQLELEAH